jgi:hypothetical protein
MSSRNIDRAIEKHERETITAEPGHSLKPYARALSVLVLVLAAVILRTVWRWASG